MANTKYLNSAPPRLYGPHILRWPIITDHYLLAKVLLRSSQTPIAGTGHDLLSNSFYEHFLCLYHVMAID